MINRRFLFAALLVVLLLTACLAGPSGPTPAATVSPPPSPTFPPPPTGTPTASLTPAPSLAPSQTARPQPAVSRVLILSLDGMRPDAIQQAPMLNLLGLMQAGAYSLVAQTISPSATLPSHTSMLTGLCPSQHGVLWNDYDPSQGYAIGADMFDLAHAAGLTTVMVVGKDKLRQITEPASTDQFKYINDRGLVIAQYIAEQVIPNGFGLLFIHFPTPDWMGHEYGWMSWQYLDVLRQDDQGLGLLLEALDQAGLRSDTLVIVTADHGGHNTTHGSSQPEDMTVPWVVSGPGVVPGGVAVPISTTDTAATAAWALGLSLPAEWAGIPVYEAFGQTSPLRPEPRCP